MYPESATAGGDAAQMVNTNRRIRGPAQERQYIIYAIIADVPDGDPMVYVDKSLRRNLKDILRYHKRCNRYVQQLFEDGENVRIFYVCDVDGTRSKAYRYVLAILRYFFELDFDVVTYYKLYEAALDLSKETQKIYSTFSEIPLEALLQTDVPHIQSNLPKMRRRMMENQDSRLSVRLTYKEKAAFQEYCDETRLSQRDAIVSLLGQGNVVDHRIEEQAAVIERQRVQIQQLMQRVRCGSRGANADKKLLDAFSYAQQGIHAYVNCLFGEAPPTGPLHCVTWSRFSSECPDRNTYEYPQEETFFIFEVEHLCYGKGIHPAVFLYGRNCMTGHKIKIRHYSKREYVGSAPNHCSFFSAGARLLVGCRRILDADVADLYFALPLPEEVENALQGQDDENVRLDDVLLNAINRSNKRKQ